jgi:hypothetical protein
MTLGNPGGEYVTYFIDIETAGNRLDLLHPVMLATRSRKYFVDYSWNLVG